MKKDSQSLYGDCHCCTIIKNRQININTFNSYSERDVLKPLETPFAVPMDDNTMYPEDPLFQLTLPGIPPERILQLELTFLLE